MSDILYTLDRNDPKYHAPPARPDWFVKALRELGGRTRYNEDMFTCEWGMDIGSDGRTDKRQRPFGVWTPKWSEVVKRETTTIFYVAYKDHSGWLTAEQMPKVMPADAVVIPKTYKRLLHFGPPVWVILQWKPPEMYATPEEYAAARWVYSRKPLEYPNSVYDQTTGMYKADSLGDYPSRGIYELVFRVTNEEGGYVSLDDAGHLILEDLKRRLREREQYTMSREQAIEAAYAHAAEEEEREGKLIYEDAVSFFSEPSSRTRLVEGDAFAAVTQPRLPTTPATVVKRGGERIVLTDNP